MPINSQPDKLSSKEYVTVILRLLISEHGQLVRGEVVDIEGRSQGRFSGWQRLEKTVKDALGVMKNESAEDP